MAAATCAALAARGERVAAFKPAVTGLDEAPGDWPFDHELLASAASAGQRPQDVAPYRLGAPASPQYAAELAATAIDPRRLIELARACAGDADAVVVEGVGGLMVPLTRDYLVRDLAADLELPVVIAARAGLGTINHALLTVEAARAGGLTVAGVVMTPWGDPPEPIELSNRDAVERQTGVGVVGLRSVSRDGLAEGGLELPVDEWVGA